MITNQRLVDGVLPEAASRSCRPTAIVGEPCKRDTAPCVGLAALLVARKSAGDPDGDDARDCPADHVIGRTRAAFQSAVKQADDAG